MRRQRRPPGRLFDYDFTLRAIDVMALFDADTTELDISDSCANLFIFICMANMSATLMLPPCRCSSVTSVRTAAVCSAIESFKALLEIEPPELLTLVLGSEPTFGLGPLVDGAESFVPGVDAVSDALGVLAEVESEVEPLCDALLADPASGAA